MNCIPDDGKEWEVTWMNGEKRKPEKRSNNKNSSGLARSSWNLLLMFARRSQRTRGNWRTWSPERASTNFLLHARLVPCYKLAFPGVENSCKAKSFIGLVSPFHSFSSLLRRECMIQLRCRSELRFADSVARHSGHSSRSHDDKRVWQSKVRSIVPREVPFHGIRESFQRAFVSRRRKYFRKKNFLFARWKPEEKRRSPGECPLKSNLSSWLDNPQTQKQINKKRSEWNGEERDIYLFDVAHKKLLFVRTRNESEMKWNENIVTMTKETRQKAWKAHSRGGGRRKWMGKPSIADASIDEHKNYFNLFHISLSTVSLASHHMLSFSHTSWLGSSERWANRFFRLR